MSNLVDVGTSQVAPVERYLKLYREIHNLYLRRDFVNLQDFNTAMTAINTRFTELESKIIAELAAIQIGLATHIHVAPQAPAGALPTAPPAVPPYTSAFSVTQPVVAKTTFVEQNNSALQATGPAIAPLGSNII